MPIPRHAPRPRHARHALCRVSAVGLLLASLLLAAACQPTPQPDDDHLTPDALDPPAEVPSYNELVERYNANVAELDQVWATAVVQARWLDERGRRQFEQGSGHFIYQRPHRVALTVGQLGQTALWAGANEHHYWLLNVREREGTLGRHANVGRPCSESLGLPVNPRMVPHLMGLLPLPHAAAADDAPRVELERGHYVIDPPGTGLRLWLHPRSARPTRIEMLDVAGEAGLVARLYSYERVRMDRLDRDQRPRIATHVNFYVMHDDVDADNPDLIVELDVVTDGRGRRGEVRDEAFDLDLLLRVHRLDSVRDLDEDCD